MKLQSCFSALTALALALTLPAASSRADVFDWNNITYAPSPAVATTETPLGSSNGGDALSVQFGLSTGATFSTAVASPHSAAYSDNNTYYTDGGGSTTQRSLQIVMSYATGSAFTTVTLFFATPVVGVAFNFFDVDSGTVGSGTYNDQIRAIMGIDSTTGTTVAPMTLTAGADNTVTGNDGFTAKASSSASSNSNAGNASVAFDSVTPMNQLSFVYGDSLTTTPHSVVQLIALSNLSFTEVPEPGTLAMVGLGIVGAAAAARRRKQPPHPAGNSAHGTGSPAKIFATMASLVSSSASAS